MSSSNKCKSTKYEDTHSRSMSSGGPAEPMKDVKQLARALSLPRDETNSSTNLNGTTTEVQSKDSNGSSQQPRHRRLSLGKSFTDNSDINSLLSGGRSTRPTSTEDTVLVGSSGSNGNGSALTKDHVKNGYQTPNSHVPNSSNQNGLGDISTSSTAVDKNLDSATSRQNSKVAIFNLKSEPFSPALNPPRESTESKPVSPKTKPEDKNALSQTSTADGLKQTSSNIARVTNWVDNTASSDTPNGTGTGIDAMGRRGQVSNNIRRSAMYGRGRPTELGSSSRQAQPEPQTMDGSGQQDSMPDQQAPKRFGQIMKWKRGSTPNAERRRLQKGKAKEVAPDDEVARHGEWEIVPEGRAVKRTRAERRAARRNKRAQNGHAEQPTETGCSPGCKMLLRTLRDFGANLKATAKSCDCCHLGEGLTLLFGGCVGAFGDCWKTVNGKHVSKAANGSNGLFQPADA